MRCEPSSPLTWSGQTSIRFPNSAGSSSCCTTVAIATGLPSCTERTTSPSSGIVSALTYSTYTSMIPPQVNPTANASSSLTPNRCNTGVPSSTTCPASSYTAPSTQPPDTLPVTEPSGATNIAAPGARGAEENVATTVPTPTVSPAVTRR